MLNVIYRGGACLSSAHLEPIYGAGDIATDPVDGTKIEPEPESESQRYPMARRGTGTRGNRVSILTNHFKVNVRNLDGDFFHYSVALFHKDGLPVHGKGVRRKLLDELYDNVFAGKEFAYDGDKSLFTLGSLGHNKLEIIVVLEDIRPIRNNGNSSPGNDCDRKRLRLQYPSKTYKVEISFAAKIPMKAIANALRGQESESSQKAIRVLDILLRQHAARQGCLLVGQSFFHNGAKNFTDVGGGVFGLRGFCSSFRTTQSGLSLNIDVSTTMIIQPGPVMDFLLANQNVRDPSALDWVKVKSTLKNLRITTSHTNKEYKITGLSEKPCREQLFILKQKKDDGDIEGEAKEVTVYDYFVNHLKIDLRCSADFPCIDVGKPKRPTYLPIELCSLVSLQRYTKALSTFQRSSLLEKSRQKPEEMMSVLRNALKINNYGAEPMLRSFGISIRSRFTHVTGRVLPTPKLKVARGCDLPVHNGRWNFDNRQFICACKIEKWAVVNFSSGCDIRNLIRELKRVGEAKGITVEDPFGHVFEESHEFCQAPPLVRVDKMFEELQRKLPCPPKFLLCLLSERKTSDLYGPWKLRSLSDFGIVTQCLAPTLQVNDQYLTNLLLKINAKLGGVSSFLAGEVPGTIPVVSKVPTLILGMYVSHCSPGRDIPSIAAVVSSRHWPFICRYRGAVRTQSPKLEMMDSLYKRVSETEDDGIMNEVLLDFYTSSRKRKPDQIIIFRDGVGESQFNQVLNIELNQIIEACKFLDEKWCPKFVVIIAQRNHRTKLFLPNCPDNVQPGTIIDNKVCHPKNNDFYLCAHGGMIGTTRPTHYHVLLDEVGFSPDDLQELVHSLSYVYQRSTTAVSVVAPVRYAHLAASQLGQWMKFQDASSHNETGSRTAPSVPPMPKLHENVRNTMFFC